MDEALRSLIRRREAIIDEVRKILVDDLYVQVPPASIEVDALLFATGLGLDSLDAVELVVASEQRFGVAMPMDVLRGQLRSINTLADLVIELQDAKAR
ncbi:MAG: acyl carrier protein [Labilithrix sp.]|nr:acyl carrier protein [Labilithrix sp.]